ncbi:MAG: lipocalin family protein [Alistipes sp.]|nr:lipocalin family protein [Alistipes sp.]
MKSFKIVALAMMLLVAFTGCEPASGPGGKAKGVVGEWSLVQWNEEAPEFHVYVAFAADGTFEMYQQVWSFDYELFKGEYTLSGDVLTGVYEDGTNWACAYRVEKVDDKLYMYSQEDISVTSVYEACTIPVEIIGEATTTRTAEVVPFL